MIHSDEEIGRHFASPPLGYRMPAEWEPHAATWLSWPRREGISFPDAYDRVLPTLRAMVEALLESEPVCINVGNERPRSGGARRAWQRLAYEGLTFHHIPTNEAWCRDHGPIFLTRDEEPRLAMVDWDYNAWGGKYPPCDLDEVVPTRIGENLGAAGFLSAHDSGRRLNRRERRGRAAHDRSLVCSIQIAIRILHAPRSSRGYAIISASAKFSGSATASRATTPTDTSMI